MTAPIFPFYVQVFFTPSLSCMQDAVHSQSKVKTKNPAYVQKFLHPPFLSSLSSHIPTSTLHSVSVRLKVGCIYIKFYPRSGGSDLAFSMRNVLHLSSHVSNPSRGSVFRIVMQEHCTRMARDETDPSVQPKKKKKNLFLSKVDCEPYYGRCSYCTLEVGTTYL